MARRSISSKPKAESFPQGLSYDFQGESRQFVQEGNTLAITFVFALIVIFLVLAAQLRVSAIPSSFLSACPHRCSARCSLSMSGLAYINIYTQIGLVTLIGLISKHGILMVDFANKLQEEQGFSRRGDQASRRIRLRPILMTTAAMVIGVVPLLIAKGAGATSRFDIGLVIAAGMPIGTMFTLFITPAVYTYLAKDYQKQRAAEQTASPDGPARPKETEEPKRRPRKRPLAPHPAE